MSDSAPTIDTNIRAMLDKLYVATREMQSNQTERPVFVLVSNGPEQRAAIEDAFFRYFSQKYGMLLTSVQRITEQEHTQNFTRLEFSELGFSIMLMDW